MHDRFYSLGEWMKCSIASNINTHMLRGPSNLGPARRVAESPFLIVIGTIKMNTLVLFTKKCLQMNVCRHVLMLISSY